MDNGVVGWLRNGEEVYVKADKDDATKQIFYVIRNKEEETEEVEVDERDIQRKNPNEQSSLNKADLEKVEKPQLSDVKELNDEIDLVDDSGDESGDESVDGGFYYTLKDYTLKDDSMKSGAHESARRQMYYGGQCPTNLSGDKLRRCEQMARDNLSRFGWILISLAVIIILVIYLMYASRCSKQNEKMVGDHRSFSVDSAQFYQYPDQKCSWWM